ncbi:MAG: ATP-binding protein [Anaerolineae bacterium]|nr:ATP-binding protein [Anaerolineae bacterium]
MINDVAADDYKDPYLFFKKTYLTAGLNNLLTRVHAKLTTGQGPSVVQIQTPFGGGKTHALVTIYHYLKHGAEVKELLPPGVALISPDLAAVAGNQWNPLEGRTTDGVTRRTFWGEVAFWIGGAEGYEEFRQDDERRISPGKEKLRQFLEAHQPFVILFDEILEYVNRALDVRDQIEVSLGTQTFSFFQELTEAVSSLPRGMMIVTLPSSHLEDFGEQEEESLACLSKIFGRVESIETPVQGEEVYAVIRRRLFEEETLQRVPMREIVHRYFQTYLQHRDDLPAKARDASFRDKMEMAYPFHPDVLDILYEKWSTFSTFQRTRGVLRLLANVVEDLYQREVPLDVILPGDINLDHPAIRQEFLKHVGTEYEGVIGSDIAGHEAKAQALDQANKPWKHLAQRVSTAVFFHSFSADDSEKGVSLPYIKLATLRSDTIPALVTDVLQRLSNELWYLNSRADAFYFSRIPNLNRMILDKKELFNESYEPTMREIIEKEIGKQFTSYLWPESGEGIPDNRNLKLVILHPDDAGTQIPEWIERRGEGFREYKNTLFFALADTAAFVKLREDVKSYLALKEIEDGIKSGDTPQLETKRDEIQRRLHSLARDFSFNVRRMYHTLQIGGRKVDLGQPVAGSETLGNWYWRELTSTDVGAIATQLGHRLLSTKFLAENEQVVMPAVLDQFYKNPELPAPAEQEVVARAIQLGVLEGAFGLAEVREGEIVPDTLRYREEMPLLAVAFEERIYLVSKERSAALQTQMAPEEEVVVTPEPTGVGVTPVEVEVSIPSPGETGAAPAVEHFKRVRLVVSGIPASKIADVNRGILMPISRAVGEFTFTLEIGVASEEGISKATLENQIKETIRQIGARIQDEAIE